MKKKENQDCLLQDSFPQMESSSPEEDGLGDSGKCLRLGLVLWACCCLILGLTAVSKVSFIHLTDNSPGI